MYSTGDQSIMIFPFDLPTPTAFYVSLYIVTFALHQALMHYVVAGSCWVACSSIFSGSTEAAGSKSRLAAVTGDWMPFLLSAAITAGVAPLLFVQILYAHNFYTANLLLGWRWMIVVPVLVVAFYLLYLLKSRWFAPRSTLARSLVSLAAAACFLFVGFCWTANHLLANNEAVWTEVYVANNMQLAWRQVACRMLIWFGGSFATLAVLAGWQLAGHSVGCGENIPRQEIGQLVRIAITGLSVACAAAIVYLFVLSPAIRNSLLGFSNLPYLVAVLVGVGVQVSAWICQWRYGLCRRWLGVASVACGVTILSTSTLREQLRIASIDVSTLHETHSTAAGIGGFAVFIIIGAVNVSLIVLCIWLVRRSLVTSPQTDRLTAE